ncbi:MAG TPA: polysaccharide deacetylase family protein, partial [Solirubrobacteraceae bacterium]|nr:polysaccharide deacetylase family protein [Solirubrobacteraceae bacterium]
MAPRWKWDFEDEQAAAQAPAPPAPGPLPAPPARPVLQPPSARATRLAQVRRRRRGAIAVVVAIVVVLAVILTGSHHGAARSGSAAAARRAAGASPIPRPNPEAETNAAVSRVLGFTPFVSAGGGQARDIALTFDDGPGPYTPQVLDVLERHHVR